jgi:hypothetical protein
MRLRSYVETAVECQEELDLGAFIRQSEEVIVTAC